MRQLGYINTKSTGIFFRAILVILVLFASCNHVNAEDNQLIVFAPDVKGPYSKIFENIVDGIKQVRKEPVRLIYLNKNTSQKFITDSIRLYSKPGKPVIAISNSIHATVSNAVNDRIVLGCAIDYKSDSVGTSNFINPKHYFSLLHKLNNNINNVILFYNKNDENILESYNQISQDFDIKITPIEITNIESAIRQTGSVFNALNNKNTAVFFQRNVIELDRELILPFILEESWNKNIIIFSSRIAHVRRGTLFSLYPDFVGVGKQTGMLIDSALANKRQTEFLNKYQIFLNTRTANHLGIKTKEIIDKNEIVLFPSRQ